MWKQGPASPRTRSVSAQMTPSVARESAPPLKRRRTPFQERRHPTAKAAPRWSARGALWRRLRSRPVEAPNLTTGRLSPTMRTERGRPRSRPSRRMAKPWQQADASASMGSFSEGRAITMEASARGAPPSCGPPQRMAPPPATLGPLAKDLAPPSKVISNGQRPSSGPGVRARGTVSSTVLARGRREMRRAQ